MQAPASSSKSPRNYTVDVFRLIGAFAVVVLHSSYGDMPTEWVIYGKLSMRWAVPFFFLVSGYFFEQRYRDKPEKTFLSTLTKLISVFFTANIIYALYLLCTDQTRFQSLLINRTIAQGFYFHLWFLGSMLIGYLLLWFLLSKQLEKLFPLLILLFIGYNLAADTYNYLFSFQLNHEFARQVLSVPFLLLGYLISKYAYAERLQIWTAVLLLVLGLVTQVVEASYLDSSGHYNPYYLQFALGTTPLALGLFFLSLKIQRPQDSFLAKAGRKYSLLIYLYHPLLNEALLFLLKESSSGTTTYLYWISPLIVFVFNWGLLVLLNKKFHSFYKLIS